MLLLAGLGGMWLASVGLRPMTSALEMQRQFMADASHELRTPVSVVRAATDVTLSRDHRDEAEYREALTIIRGQARSMSRLVEDMLVLSRAEAGGYPLQVVDLYLDELVGRVPAQRGRACGGARGRRYVWPRPRRSRFEGTKTCCGAA